ncbi:MAG: cysteine desulfurase NifS [Candidatus Diapherotrites archaeon]
MKRIYMDNAATTRMDARVLHAMLPYFSEKFGNASSLHASGREAAEALEQARGKVAGVLGAKAGEVCFTSGGTEADNLAVKGAAFANSGKGNHIITSAIEHPAVLQTCKFLERKGFEVTYLPVDGYGLVDAGALERAMTKKTILVSVMHANNEVGTIEPAAEIGKICAGRGVLFHTDAVQTFGKIATDVKRLNADLLSMSSHKIYGPKGAGALYIREGVALEPLMHGGGHERKMRAGTENIAGIAGFGEAAAICAREMKMEAARETALREGLVKGVLSEIEGSRLNGHPKKRLPGNVNISFEGIEGESLIMRLDMKGIAASTGSACSSKSLKASHVLLACGLEELEAHGSLRLTLGRTNTKADVEYVLKALPGIVEGLGKISPIAK